MTVPAGSVSAAREQAAKDRARANHRCGLTGRQPGYPVAA
jgi:hypothetical protein